MECKWFYSGHPPWPQLRWCDWGLASPVGCGEGAARVVKARQVESGADILGAMGKGAAGEELRTLGP